jgi:hypothetical protein
VYSPKPLSLDEGMARNTNAIHEISEQHLKNILSDFEYLFEILEVNDFGYVGCIEG